MSDIVSDDAVRLAVEAGTAQLHAELRGTGPALVWGHGLMASMASDPWIDWQKLSRELTVVRYDARGHGLSGPAVDPLDHHWDKLGRDMLAVADAAKAAQFIAGGVSMGCATAVWAALQAPGRVRALLLVLPPAAWEAREAQATTWRRAAALGKALAGRSVAKLMGKAIGSTLPPWLAEAGPGKVAALAGEVNNFDGSTWGTLMSGAAGTNMPPREQFSALAQIPAAIFAWADDPAHPLASAHELHRLLPQSHLFIARNYADFTALERRIGEFALTHA